MPGGDQVVARDVGLVAQRHEAGEAQPAGGGGVQQGDPDTPRLGADGERSGAGAHRPERGVQPGAAQVAQHPEAVGSDQAHVVGAGEGGQPLLAACPLRARLGQPGGEHHAGVGAAEGEPLDGRLQPRRRHRDHGQVDALREVRHVGDAVGPGHGQLGVPDRVEGAAEATGPQVLEHLPPDPAARPAHSHDGDRRRLEEPSHGRPVGVAVPAVGRQDRGDPRRQVQAEREHLVVALLDQARSRGRGRRAASRRSRRGPRR